MCKLWDFLNSLLAIMFMQPIEVLAVAMLFLQVQRNPMKQRSQYPISWPSWRQIKRGKPLLMYLQSLIKCLSPLRSISKCWQELPWTWSGKREVRGGKSRETKKVGSRISPETGAGSSQVKPSKFLHHFPFRYWHFVQAVKKNKNNLWAILKRSFL